jgi:hypothetical protein
VVSCRETQLTQVDAFLWGFVLRYCRAREAEGFAIWGDSCCGYDFVA